MGRLRGGCQALLAAQPDFVKLASVEQGLRMGQTRPASRSVRRPRRVQHALQREPGMPAWLRDQTPTLGERTPLYMLARRGLDAGLLRLPRKEGRLQALHRQ